MKKSLFNFAATMLMSAGAVVFNACSDDNTDSDGGVGTLEVTPASLETIADYGGSFSFDVRSNSYWHVSVEDADELPLDWASADIVSGMGNASVNLSVETNDGQTVRTGRIVFELDDMSSLRKSLFRSREMKQAERKRSMPSRRFPISSCAIRNLPTVENIEFTLVRLTPTRKPSRSLRPAIPFGA